MEPNVQQAIDIIADLARTNGAGRAAFWVFPNVILTLSGARANCDSVLYHPNARRRAEWLAAINETLPVIKHHLPLRWFITVDTKNPMGQNFVGYELLTNQGLERLPHQTELLGENFQITGNTPQKIIAELISRLARNKKTRGLNKTNLRHAAGGLILGYPDNAIVGTLKDDQAESKKRNHNFAERPIQADIRGADYYVCPQPVYSYPRRLAENPRITAHEQLWSKILKDFYTSPLHKTLAKTPAFQKQITELTKY